MTNDPREVIGEVRARLCDDGSCAHSVMIGRVGMLCTHPNHMLNERVAAWDEAQYDKELTGLTTIIDYGPLTYSGVASPGRIV